MMPVIVLIGRRGEAVISDNFWDLPHGLEPEAYFALRMSHSLDVPVPVLGGFLPNAPADSFIVSFERNTDFDVSDCPEDRRMEIARRTICMEGMWPNLYKQLEQHQLAGAVDLRRYWEWKKKPEQDVGEGLYGLIAVAERAGMTYRAEPKFGSERYAHLSCDHCSDLPSLIAHYLRVYEEMGFHVRPQGNTPEKKKRQAFA